MVPSLAAGAGAGVPLYSRQTEEWCAGREVGRSSKDLPLAGWCHPLRRSGIMVTRRLFGFEARDLMMMVAGEGIEPP